MPNPEHPPNQYPEQIARDKIDRQLREAGWIVQDWSEPDIYAGLGIAVREYHTDSGDADYVLISCKHDPPALLGIIEAKPENWGHKLAMVEEQTAKYAGAKFKHIITDKPPPFIYESTGAITRFTDGRDPNPRSREVFTFHRPETLLNWFEQEESLRARLASLPPLKGEKLRECQTAAIVNLENSLAEAKPRALIQMATGAGKTFTAISSAYRLLKFADAYRFLFLVDTKNLGEQAEQEFLTWVPPDDNRKFNELYNVQRLTSSVPPTGDICISTVQRMYAILKGEDLDEAAEERPAVPKKQLPVVYSSHIPPEHFDFIIIDECHRSIYNVWRQVIEYFDAFLIGLTATPDNRTYGFFNKNVVSEYTHERAVADGVNVGNEIYRIKTERTENSTMVEAGSQVEWRERQTRKTRWEALDEDETFPPKELDRSIVIPDQIRTVISTFKEKLPEIFPNRAEVPKTLIFAKDDSHAADIVDIVREEFGKGNDFCKKVTYRAEEGDDPNTVLARFRNDYDPRIAVTVNMIATGTDVKPLECLLFMRDVRSANYFEQMKGRGTRVLAPDDLRKVTPTAQAKTHYVIVDAVGVTESIKTGSRPLDVKPKVSLRDLAISLMMGQRDEDTVTSLASRLDRLDRRLNDIERERIEREAGQSLRQIVGDLFDAIDPDTVERETGAESLGERSAESLNTTRDRLVKEAGKVLTGKVIKLIDSIRREKEQIVADHILDNVIETEWAGETKENAEALTRDFTAWLEENRDRIEALTIFFNHPARRAEVTFRMIHEVLDTLKADRPRLAPLHVWQAWAHLEDYKGENPETELTKLVSLIRRATGLDDTLTPNTERVRRNFQNWVMKRHSGAGEKFNDEQMAWLRMIRDHLEASFHIEPDDLNMTPFDAKGGLGRMHEVFRGNVDEILVEMNEAIAA